MSLILEALRKSEAERRRGQAPDLFTELPPAARHREVRLSTVVWVVLAAIMLMAGAWLARGLWSATTHGDGDAILTIPDDQSSQTPREPTASQSAVAGAAAASERENTARVAGVAGVAGVDAASPETTAVAPALPSAPAPRPTASAGTGATEQRSAVTPSDAPERDPPRSEPRDVAGAVPVTAPASATTPSTSTPAGGTTTTIELTGLTIEQRKQLPPLRMSMHMWYPDPTRRFVIIDGVRRGEGDRIGQAVVEHISADSVLLNWNGLRLRLSLR